MDPISTAPAIQKFGNDVAVAEPSSTNTKNYTVLDSDMAKQDYLTKQKFLDQEQQNYITQSMVNQQNSQITKSNDDTNKSADKNTEALNNATSALTSPYKNGKDSSGGLNSGYTDANGQLTYTGNSGSSAPSTGDPYADQINQQNADLLKQYAQTQSQLQTASTVAGLSSSQQSQLSSLAGQYDTLISNQTHANDVYNGSVTMGTIRSGSNRYATAIAASTVAQAVNTGIAKISDLTNKKQGALEQMKQGFISDNVKAVNDAYKAYSDMSKQITDNIKLIQDHVNDLHTQQVADTNLALNQQKADQQAQQDARDYATTNNITSPAYQIGDKVYDTATGKEIDPGKIDQSQIQSIDPTSKAAADYVKSLATKYPDAVFPTMTPDQAQKALQYSKIYREQVRPPEYVTNPSGSGSFKFASGDASRLLSVGLTNSEISAIQTNLNNGASIDDVLKASSLTDDQKKTVKNTMSGITALQESKDQGKFITSDYIKNYFTPDELKQAAISSGFHGSLRTNNATDQDVTNYINSITKKVTTLQGSGLSDQDIWKQLFGG